MKKMIILNSDFDFRPILSGTQYVELLLVGL